MTAASVPGFACTYMGPGSMGFLPVYIRLIESPCRPLSRGPWPAVGYSRSPVHVPVHRPSTTITALMTSLRSNRRAAAVAGVLALMATAFTPSRAIAQPLEGWGRHTITLQIGGFTHDYYGDDMSPMIAVRSGWRFHNWAIAELGGMYTRPETPGDFSTNMFGVDLGVRAEAPLSTMIRPYLGLATGIHGTFEPEGGDRFFGPSTQALGGLHLGTWDGLGVRLEARYRLDGQQDGASADNMELTAGLTWVRR